jgi:hypothetical protein
MKKIFLMALVWSMFGVLPNRDTNTTHYAYIPLIAQTRIIVGAEYEREMCAYQEYINPRTNVQISIHWGDVEYEKGTYDWTVPDNKLCGNQADYIVVKMTPEWARESGAPACKLPPVQYWDEAVAFYRAVVYRYNPEYLAIWNEPDMPFIVGGDDYLGCMPDDPASYIEFVKYVAPRIINTKVVAGEVANVFGDFAQTIFPALENHVQAFSFHCYAKFDGEYEPTCDGIYHHMHTNYEWKEVISSETAVYYVSGEPEAYYQSQVDHFNAMLEMGYPFYWYTNQCHGWPWNSLSTDMLYCDEHNIIPRPVWSLYMEQ